jgi:two-component system, NarL family, sensor histidine kinase UhpB
MAILALLIWQWLVPRRQGKSAVLPSVSATGRERPRATLAARTGMLLVSGSASFSVWSHLSAEAQVSLRFRLIGLVCVVLLISLALAGMAAYSNASRSVRTEMRAAFLVGRQTIESAIDRLQNARDPSRALDDLVASFKGNRHLRVRYAGETPALAAPSMEKSKFGRPPAWFVRLIGVSPETDQIPIGVGGRDYGTIVIETDPYNETLEVWNEFAESLATLAVFGGLTILIIYVFIGRTLRPLDRLAAALEEVGDGHYRIRIGGRLAPDLARLRDNFNRMAARLAEAAFENCRLNERLLTLQEEERSELARDLHDEVSPYLFAINADAATASRLIENGRASDATLHVRSIVEAVRHMQRQIRRMLARLRPIGLAEFGLREAIENLVAFWRRRRPEIRYEVTVSAECEDFVDVVGTVICRIVQEALSNALRHAEPKHVAISIERDRDLERGRDEIRLSVVDDGQGMRDPDKLGYGLIGISERVSAVGGRFSFTNKSEEGFAVIAVLPYPQASVSVSSSAQSADP